MLDKKPSQTNIMVNIVGISQTPNTKLESLIWIIDSGATNHMASNLDMMHDVQTVTNEHSRRVYLPNGG